LDLTRGKNGVVDDFNRNELKHDFGMLLFNLFVQGLQVSGFMGLTTVLWSICEHDLGLRPCVKENKQKEQGGDLRNSSHG
jgi:hypothetical protein